MNKLILATAAFAMTGCITSGGSGDTPTEPITSELAAEQAAKNLELHLGSVEDLLRLLEGMPAAERGLAEAGCEDCLDQQETDEAMREAIEELKARMVDASLIEEDTGRSITYRLSPEAVCEEADPEDNEECTRELTQVPIRVKVTAPREGDLDLALQIGEPRYEPLSVALHQTSLGLEVDLGAAAESAQLLIAAVEGEGGQLPFELAGTLSLELKPTDAGAILSFDSTPIRLDAEAPDQRGGERFSAHLGASSLVLDLSREAEAVLMDLQAAFGGLNLEAPLAFLVGQEASCELVGDEVNCERREPPAGNMELVAPTAKLHFSARSDTNTLNLDSLIFGGPARMAVNGQPMIEVDLNAGAGRQLSALFETAMTIEESFDVTVSPGIDLKVDLRPSVLAAALGESEPVVDDQLRVLFEGAAAPKLRVSAERLKVIEGTLTLSSTAEEISLSIDAGQCMASTEEARFEDDFETEEAGHPLESFEAVACQ